MKLSILRDRINKLLEKYPDIEVMLAIDEGFTEVSGLCGISVGSKSEISVAFICDEDGTEQIKKMSEKETARFVRSLAAWYLARQNEKGEECGEWKQHEIKTKIRDADLSPEPTHPYAWARAGMLGPQ